ncbi:hypothetical protein [Pedobacter sp. Leaf194]|uniref:hypothetical protein n=1 Tax=Pedobacter sp. Leaf194 TaxID=1736297 RepID=UPI000703AE71|nr:hypothetical protein [Pedobacter sp. Leaf194]KQS41756.1 hypothetical protein ASG14_04715 [Pedobacter sp. Leaf194]
MDKTSFPLVILKEIKVLMKELHALLTTNNQIIEIYDYPSALIAYRSISVNEFYFDVMGPTVIGDEIIYRLHLCPTDETNQGISSYDLNIKNLTIRFKEWIELMKEYDSFSFTDDDVITKQYETEFYSDWEILDEDADDKAFEPDKQVLLYNWLTLLEHDLKSNEMVQEDDQIVEETAQLRADIQNLTKRQFILRFAKLMSKVKKTGLKLLYDVFDMAKKEALKKLLYGGIDVIGDITQHIHLL